MMNLEIQEIYMIISKKAAEDEKFKEKLLTNPKEAIFEATQHKFDDDVKVSVYESTPEDLHFVIPY